MMKSSTSRGVPLGVFFYAGFAGLFAYNMLLFELGEFGTVISGSEGSAKKVNDYLTIVYGGACNLGLVLNIVFLGKALSMNARIILGSLLGGAMIFFMAAFANLLPATKAFGLFALITIAVFAMAGSTLQGALGAAVSKCPGSAITAMSLGQAAAGVPTWPIGTLLASVTENVNVRLFIALGLTAVAMFGIFPVYRYWGGESYVQEQEKVRSISTTESQPEVGEKVSKMAVIKHIWPQILVVWLSMFVTFSALPEHFLKWAFTMNLVNFKNLIWCFQIADTFGRLCTFVVPLPSDAGIFAFTGLRVLLIPICFLVTFKVFSVHWIACYVLAALLAFSLAFNLTWGLIRGPQRCDTAAQKDIAGMVLTFALLNGIFLGSLSSQKIMDLTFQ